MQANLPERSQVIDADPACLPDLMVDDCLPFCIFVGGRVPRIHSRFRTGYRLDFTRPRRTCRSRFLRASFPRDLLDRRRGRSFDLQLCSKNTARTI